MEHIIEPFLLIGLFIDQQMIELSSLVGTWEHYSDLSAVLAMALMTSLALDQLSFLNGKFRADSQKDHKESQMGLRNPIMQFIKFQLWGSLNSERNYLDGAGQISQLKFFSYNLIASGMLLIATILAGAALRSIWVANFGHFGPFEVEVISGIVTVYVLGLLFIYLTRSTSRTD